MPLRMIADLDGKFERFSDYRSILADVPTSLNRVEAAADAFRRARGRLLESSPAFHELRGVVAGLDLAHSEILEEGSRVAASERDAVSRVARHVRTIRDLRTLEMRRLAERVDAEFAAAAAAIEVIADVLRDRLDPGDVDGGDSDAVTVDRRPSEAPGSRRGGTTRRAPRG